MRSSSSRLCRPPGDCAMAALLTWHDSSCISILGTLCSISCWVFEGSLLSSARRSSSTAGGTCILSPHNDACLICGDCLVMQHAFRGGDNFACERECECSTLPLTPAP